MKREIKKSVVVDNRGKVSQ